MKKDLPGFCHAWRGDRGDPFWLGFMKVLFGRLLI